MKRNIYITIVTSMLAMVSCQKLDREFVTTINKNDFLSNYGTVSGLLTSVYSELPDGLLYINGNAMMASATDEAEFTQDPHPVQNFNIGNWNAVNNPDDVWAKYYRGIRRANQLIVSTGQINNDAYKLDPTANGQSVYLTRVAEIKRWTYEARVLRAFYYFELVKRYGGVPLITTEVSTGDDFSVYKRNTLQECINFIVSECDAAAPELPPYIPAGTTTVFNYNSTTDLGRVTAYAALALKSRTLLYAASDLFNDPSWASGYANPELIALPAGDRNARWKAASDAAKACIDKLGGLGLATDYRALFNTYQNNEIILSRVTASSNAFEKTNFPIGFALGNSGNTPTQDLVDAYEVKVGTGSSATSVPFDWNNPAHVANIYNFSTATTSTDIRRDPRLNYTVVTNGYDPLATPTNLNLNSTTNGKAFGTPLRFVQTYVGGLDGMPKPFATKTGYYLRKYIIESLNLSTGNTGVHSWIIFRIPELYLNYAEALNEWNAGNSDIKKYVDLVRNRSGVTMPLLPAGLTQDQMRTRIRNERRVELAFEDHRAWDVRRWMTAPTALGGPVRGVSINQAGTNSFTYQPGVIENRVFQPKMYLYPIPQSEISISTNLVQNPLW